jgi:putative transcriptional regulator
MGNRQTVLRACTEKIQSVLSRSNIKEVAMSALSIARKAAKLTQQDLAEKVGLTQAAIGHYESGRRTPRLAECRRIVSVLSSAGVSCSLETVFPEDPAATETKSAA